MICLVNLYMIPSITLAASFATLSLRQALSESKRAVSPSFRHDRSHGDTPYRQGSKSLSTRTYTPNDMLNGHTLNWSIRVLQRITLA